ncbi:MAG: protein-export chaperone SecB [Proteobacteria bacterium]|nr:protein-export chaperone SecB [Pseudomonadota bacterium]MBU1057551.1 protein-export chaperone SecB [Pseudomonadota bacterium]
MAEEKGNNGTSGDSPVFRMQKMYIKDFSFENPNAPEVYQSQNQEPKVEVNLKLNNKKLDDDHWEVSLQITAKIIDKGNNDKTMFIMEIEHAAAYLLKNIPAEHLEMVLGVDCPTLLFPFTRQIVSQISVDGGFIPFLMEPINFMALYQNSKKKEAEKQN